MPVHMILPPIAPLLGTVAILAFVVLAVVVVLLSLGARR